MGALPVVAPMKGRVSTHYNQLQELRKQRKMAAGGRADEATMEWFHSGEIDKELEKKTKEHGTGRYYNEDGEAIDIHQFAFKDFLQHRPQS